VYEGFECGRLIAHLPFFLGSSIKYLWRAGEKTEHKISDLVKARRCFERWRKDPSDPLSARALTDIRIFADVFKGCELTPEMSLVLAICRVLLYGKDPGSLCGLFDAVFDNAKREDSLRRS
jgi:hypothetical protein